MLDARQRLLVEIERQLGWPPAAGWTAAHFDELSESILTATGTQLSPTTLKRVWGHVAYRSQPSRTTMDTLAQFAGYGSWVLAQAQLASREPAPEASTLKAPTPEVTPSVAPADGPTAIPLEEPPTPLPASESARRIRPALLGISAAVATLLLASALIQRYAEPYAGPPPAVARFDFAPITEEPPTTVQFRYGVHGTYDSLSIQQSWDERLRRRVDPTRDFFAMTYYLPGAYRAKLVADDSVLTERPLIIPSGGWLGTHGGDEGEVPEYVREEALRTEEGHYRLMADATAGLHLGAGAEIHFIGGAAVAPEAQRATVRTRFINLGTDPCRWSALLVFGERGTIVLPFSAPGCTGELEVYACGQTWRGSEVDLSGFGVSPSDTTEVSVTVTDSTLMVRVGREEAFRQNLSRGTGQVAGARWSFVEGGEVLGYAVE